MVFALQVVATSLVGAVTATRKFRSLLGFPEVSPHPTVVPVTVWPHTRYVNEHGLGVGKGVGMGVGSGSGTAVGKPLG